MDVGAGAGAGKHAQDLGVGCGGMERLQRVSFSVRNVSPVLVKQGPCLGSAARRYVRPGQGRARAQCEPCCWWKGAAG